MSLHLHPPRIHAPPHPLAHDEDDEDDDSEQPMRTVRKRSSKACDNCRKAKCKCEKSADSSACRNCVLLGQECTFLGPSRKRGPPKGYIDAIEARLHQLEALLGTIIASPDTRAQSLVADLITDPLARHIIARVDESPFGSRAKDDRDPKARSHINSARTAILNGQVGFDVPPRDWQDDLGARILKRKSDSPDAQRRRLSSGSVSPSNPRHLPDESDPEPDTLTDALGQLSLNEHHQLRYHGKASGLHILAQAPAYRRDRVRMDDDGIWRFPSSRVWPPVAEEKSDSDEGLLPTGTFDDLERQVAERVLPSRAHQEKLLRLYFAYVHPVLPIIHKDVFWRDWETSANPSAPASTRIPTLLLLAIYAVAARYDASRPPPRAGTMWAAGDKYLEAAKLLLNRSYASSKASTCQALLLLSYREIGIGAMAQAWLYVGMSVRMAQDLGLHRSIDKWQAAGANTFSAAEKQTRRCIWFGCVVMDKYVSTYIGRPLAVFERDYDTCWPDDEQDEPEDPWTDMVANEKADAKGRYEPMPARVLESFVAASKLSAILSHIVEALYSTRPAPNLSRSSERAQLEEELEKWLLNLKPYLRYDITRGVLEGNGKVPPPHILTLHMMYWCSVLLLHRPSIRFNKPTRFASPEGSTASDQSTSTASTRAIGLCKLAANHITKIVSTYGENFSLGRGPAFLSYYVFSASIMHVTLLMMNPEDVQAQMGLQECMTALESMNVTWPSAGRAHELLNESKMNIQEHYLESLRHSPWRNKRKTTEEAEDEPQRERERSTSRGDSVDVQSRPVVGLRGEGMHVTRLKNGMLSHSSDSHRLHSPASSYRPPIRPLQAPAGYPSSFGQQVDGLFTDTGYARWGGELPSFGQPDGQSFFGSGAAGWDGHVQQQQQQQDPQPQGWSTSATRFSAEPNRAGATGAGPTSGSGGGAGPGPAGGGGGGNGGGTGGGGYWQDFQPPTSFGTDMSSSLYSIMPHSTVPLQSIFQDGAFSDHHHHHHPQNYPVYSRLS